MIVEDQNYDKRITANGTMMGENAQNKVIQLKIKN
jgi:hypothetical protein